jgi:hypothetical protein
MPVDFLRLAILFHDGTDLPPVLSLVSAVDQIAVPSSPIQYHMMRCIVDLWFRLEPDGTIKTTGLIAKCPQSQ